ncbi:MAG: hypothetical protein E4H36_10140 [Spirochaetales bacterium]|nr:MAG: hypothetical protein E4H36_10140 [Spirochaetales bacterium]
MIELLAGEIEIRRNRLLNLPFFDSELWLGRPLEYFAPTSGQITAGEVAGYVKARSLTGALLSTTEGVLQSPQDGNRQLLEAEEYLPDSVFTVWTGLPLFPGEPGHLPVPGNLHKRCRGIRLFPKSHRFLLEDWTAGSLCAWMTDMYLPLFLWHVETDFTELYRLVKQYPDLPVIIESQWQKILYQLRTVYNLLRACPNIRLEMSNLVLPGAVEYCVREFGAERLLFGSFYPMAEPLTAQGLLIDADISREQMVMIAGGNMEKLIREVRP